MIKIEDLSNCPLSERAGTYGGQAGFKDGIIYKGEYWIVKYPKNTKGMQVADLSYTTAPLSEYLGSKIYEILGYNVHETILGYRNGKIVVACKDFCKNEGSLREIRTLKNLANPQLASMLERSFSSTGSERSINLDEMLLHLTYNEILNKIGGIREHFWNCVVIDALINNNDRNNGNWGVLYEDNKYRIAPVYDNGAAFSNKLNDAKICEMMTSEEKVRNSALNATTVYNVCGKQLTVKKMFEQPYEELRQAIIRNVPLIQRNFEEIKKFFDDIPTEYNRLNVCSEIRKAFYIKGMECRMNHIFLPAYEKMVSLQGQERLRKPKSAGI